MATGNSIKAVPLTSFNTAAILPAPAYQAINPNGLPQACTVVNILNASNVPVTVSFDGVTPHMYFPAGNSQMLLAQVLAMFPQQTSLFSAGSVFYVAGAAVGVGSVYLSAMYQ